jgi:uracil-DNA glycosylase family 4
MADAERRAAYLGVLGIDHWVLRRAPAHEPPLPLSGWAALESDVRDCRRCALHQGRTQAVFGAGDRAADWMIVGDAPDEAGDRQGLPFVGPAGQLLDAMLGAIGLSRDAVFIAGALRCRPPGDREVRAEEIAECRAHLLQQVAMVRPRIILAFGPVAAQGLLGTRVSLDGPLDGLRGAVHRFGGVNTPVVVTYHPAALLHSPGDKRKAWEDLKFARQVHAGLEPIRE